MATHNANSLCIKKPKSFETVQIFIIQSEALIDFKQLSD